MEDHIFNIVVRAGGHDQFTAHPIGFPELQAEAATATEAVEKVRESLKDFLATSKQIKFTGRTGNPWLEAFGSAADDPDFGVYLEEIQKFRMSVDEE